MKIHFVPLTHRFSVSRKTSTSIITIFSYWTEFWSGLVDIFTATNVDNGMIHISTTSDINIRNAGKVSGYLDPVIQMKTC